ncbi:hypothetical protein Anas_09475 [Armadillidium nasatum]|uniref:Uncharacterized protein n=1 Tax=Armadillidium nasatum TaxID=96803 RepID=A0A5N5SU98_9CRUS|nr:hypothetical protein Anas_09475 [Armadillidium nasatum]
MHPSKTPQYDSTLQESTLVSAKSISKPASQTISTNILPHNSNKTNHLAQNRRYLQDTGFHNESNRKTLTSQRPLLPINITLLNDLRLQPEEVNEFLGTMKKKELSFINLSQIVAKSAKKFTRTMKEDKSRTSLITL